MSKEKKEILKRLLHIENNNFLLDDKEIEELNFIYPKSKKIDKLHVESIFFTGRYIIKQYSQEITANDAEIKVIEEINHIFSYYPHTYYLYFPLFHTDHTFPETVLNGKIKIFQIDESNKANFEFLKNSPPFLSKTDYFKAGQVLLRLKLSGIFYTHTRYLEHNISLLFMLSDLEIDKAFKTFKEIIILLYCIEFIVYRYQVFTQDVYTYFVNDSKNIRSHLISIDKIDNRIFSQLEYKLTENEWIREQYSKEIGNSIYFLINTENITKAFKSLFAQNNNSLTTKLKLAMYWFYESIKSDGGMSLVFLAYAIESFLQDDKESSTVAIRMVSEAIYGKFNFVKECKGDLELLYFIRNKISHGHFLPSEYLTNSEVIKKSKELEVDIKGLNYRCIRHVQLYIKKKIESLYL